MKIICTEIEKTRILKALDDSGVCPHEDSCLKFFPDKKFDCKKCCTEHIEWQIEDGDGDG